MTMRPPWLSSYLLILTNSTRARWSEAFVRPHRVGTSCITTCSPVGDNALNILGTDGYSHVQSRHSVGRRRREASKSLGRQESRRHWTFPALFVTGGGGGGGTYNDDYDELPKDFPRREDALIALAAVRKACAVTRALQPVGGKSTEPKTTQGDSDSVFTVTKMDLSPVTVGDFAAQGLILDHLNQSFESSDTSRENSFIAEESSQDLQNDPELAELILNVTGMDSVEHVMDSIDLGKQYLKWDGKENLRPKRVWCLDPIDGTKGFLRGKRSGGQYAVGLALIEDGVPTVGVLGCPNLPISPSDGNYVWRESENEETNQHSRGCIFIASKGGGSLQLPLFPAVSDDDSAAVQRIRVTPNDGSSSEIPSPNDGRFCVGVEKGIADALGRCDEMAKILHGRETALDSSGEIIKSSRIDSMAKYAVIARGQAEYYVRLPKPEYVENIWDHAAGVIIIEEAGGKITDQDGLPLDFSLGPKLSDKIQGIFGSNGGEFHDALLRSFNQQEVATDDS